MPLNTGQTLINRYRIVSLLGEGGFGAVYRAWDLNLEKPVALKENFETSPEAQRQFKTEAQILAELDHPNLPRVTDHFFISNQGQYLIMDYVDGEDLQEFLDRGQIVPEKQVMDWVSQVCDALSYLHSLSPPIIHRDIKPSNIKIRPDGRAMLVDFGIAKVYDENLATTSGAKAVTPGFSPPEQYGQGKTDTRSDIYALGATIYALLTGNQPTDALDRLVHDEPLPSPEQFNTQISPSITRATLRAMEVTTKKRFQSVDEFKAALAEKAAESYSTPPPEPVSSPPQTLPGKSQKRGWMVAGLVVVVLVGVALVTAIGGFLPVEAGNTEQMTVSETKIEVDGNAVEPAGDDFLAVACGESHRIEAQLLDTSKNLLESGLFTYNWRFGPGDGQNEDTLNSSNYAINYYVPCELEYQTVTLEVLQNEQALFTQSIRFEIKQ